MQKIRLSIHLFDVPKFIRLRDNNEYLEKICGGN